MTDKTQPEALRLAEQYDYGDPVAHSNTWKAAVCTELRRQHARIAEMEAQLEAVGAGGVSGPMMGQPQAMPDISALTERGAKAWAGVDAQGLREGVASAGSEPVATVFTMEALAPGGGVKYHATVHKPLPAGTKLYTHPSPPEGMAGGWMPIETAPRDGTEVLANTFLLGRVVVYWDDEKSQWGTGLGYLDRGAPTHWMPLTPAPTSAEGVEHG